MAVLMSITIAELARAVNKSENFVRQHIHRKHLTARKDGRNVSVSLDEAVRWACERGLAFDLRAGGSVTAGTMNDRTARMSVLSWQAPDGRLRNLFTLIRHRRQDALGPWSSKPDEVWSNEDLGYALRLSSIDAPLECCKALIDHILDSSTLETDRFEIRYDLEPVPRRHWAYRDDRSLADASMRSPFLRHSAEIIEYWSFATEPANHWPEVVEALSNDASSRLPRLGFPLNHRPDRAGNLMIAGAQDAISCDLYMHHDGTLRLAVDGNQLLPTAYRATVWATHSGDDVLRREFPVSQGQTVIELASDVDHIGFAIHRTVDGQCTDLMEAILLMEIRGRIQIASGPTLELRDRRRGAIHTVRPSGPISAIAIEVNSDKDSAELDKEIRRQWLDRKVRERETAARREGNFVRFRPADVDEAIRHFIGLLSRDSDRTEPVYLADPYFMTHLKGNKGTKLYLDMFAATTGRPLRILCASKQNGNVPPWWLKSPKLITAHVSVRAFLEHNGRGHGFHDRYLITPQREIIITHSFSGWPKDGVTFASLPYNVYRAEAERLWSMDIGSTTADLLVRKIF